MPQSTSDTKEEHKGLKSRRFFPSAYVIIALCHFFSLGVSRTMQKLLNQFKLGERMAPKQD